MRAILLMMLFAAICCGQTPAERAQAAFAEGRYEDAVLCLKDALRVPSSRDGALYANLGRALERLDRPAEALAAFLSAAARLPEDEVLSADIARIRSSLDLVDAVEPLIENRRLNLRAAPYAAFVFLALLSAGAAAFTLRRARMHRRRPWSAIIWLCLLSWVTAGLARREESDRSIAAVVIPAGGALLDEPSPDSEIKARVPRGETLEVERMSSRWALVRFHSHRGWMPRDALAIVDRGRSGKVP